MDPYSLCPGGTGKKVKFCCPDLHHELDQVERLVAGDQRGACLDLVDKLLAKTPGRACLMTTKAMLHMGAGEREPARQVLQELLAQQPSNPVALAYLATIINQEDPPKAVLLLQQAIEASAGQMTVPVAEAIVDVGAQLLVRGNFLAARAHLSVARALLPDDEGVQELWARMYASPELPPIIKISQRLVPCRPDAAYAEEFKRGLDLAHKALWRKALVVFEGLGEREPRSAEVWRNLAVLRGSMADTPGAVAALHRLATLDLPEDEAVEAEALAQHLDPAAAQDRVEELTVTFPVVDLERAIVALGANRQFAKLHVDPTEWTEANLPPPRMGVSILHVPQVDAVEGLAVDQVPRVIGEAYLFGRETDREARLELEADALNLPTIEPLLTAALDGAIGPKSGQEVNGMIPRTRLAMNWVWRLPDATRPEEFRRLLAEQRTHVVTRIWPDEPQGALGGKSPRQLAGDPAAQIKLRAALLLFEQAVAQDHDDAQFVALRQTLGLPQPAPLEPSAVPVAEALLSQLPRYTVGSLSDDELLDAFVRASGAGLLTAIRKLGRELVARPALDARVDKAEILGRLAALSESPDEKLALVTEARQVAERSGRSSAPWDLAEMSIRLVRGEAEEFIRLVNHVQTMHGNEPGVRESLLQILIQAGLVGPDGRLRVPAPGAAGELAGAGAPTAQPAASGLWTPDSESAPGKKSSLYIPGME